MNLFSPDRRRLTIASVMMLLGAALHTVGNLAPPPDPGAIDVRTVMANYHLALGLGMSPSMWNIQRTLAFTMSICVVAIAWLGLSAALTALCPYYGVPPPLIMFRAVPFQG